VDINLCLKPQELPASPALQNASSFFLLGIKFLRLSLQWLTEKEKRGAQASKHIQTP
jgi:hypothetical protein